MPNSMHGTVESVIFVCFGDEALAAYNAEFDRLSR